MGSKIFVFVCIQMAIFNAAYTQVLNRVLPNVVPIGEPFIQNQMLLNSLAPNLVRIGPNIVPIAPNVVPFGPNIFPVAPNVVPVAPNVVPIAPNVVPVAPNLIPIAPRSCNVEQILSAPMTAPATTIIQDSSVANNLANALQLLVVSNLLGNTLPTMGDVVIPSYTAPAPVDLISPVSLSNLGGYSIVF